MNEHPYITYSDYLGRHFPGRRIQKITIDGGFTCPNRDGSKGHGGCSFCNPQAFAPAYCREHSGIAAQIEAGKAFFAGKCRGGGAVGYLVYLQSFTSTYAPVSQLRRIYQEALSAEGVVGLVIGTRPDCISSEVLDLLVELRHTYFIMVELGIESCHDKTLLRVGRGHDYACAERAARLLAGRGIPVGAHIILGLPGETLDEMLQMADLLSALPLDVLKLHQLQIMQHTRMGQEWQQHPEAFRLFSAPEYADLAAAFVRRCRPDIAFDRFVSESPSRLLLAPRWGLKPQQVQQMIEQRLVDSAGGRATTQ